MMFRKDTSELYEVATKNIIPLDVMIELCHTCNQNCVHCCIADRADKNSLPLKVYRSLFKQLSELGTLFITFTGGEPFLHPEFLPIVTEARKNRLSVTIYTNGTLITESTIQELSRINVRNFEISIFSDKSELHDSITCLKGSLKKTKQNIALLQKYEMNVTLKCPLMNINFNSVENLKKFAKVNNCKITFSKTITAKDDGDTSTYRYRLSRSQLRKALSDPDITDQFIEEPRKKDLLNYHQCEDFFCGGCIDPNGEVYLCTQLRISGGNIVKSDFADIWNRSRVFQESRNIRLNDLIKCKECNLLKYCSRCAGLAYLEQFSILGCSLVSKKEALLRKELGIYAFG